MPHDGRGYDSHRAESTRYFAICRSSVDRLSTRCRPAVPPARTASPGAARWRAGRRTRPVGGDLSPAPDRPAL